MPCTGIWILTQGSGERLKAFKWKNNMDSLAFQKESSWIQYAEWMWYGADGTEGREISQEAVGVNQTEDNNGVNLGSADRHGWKRDESRVCRQKEKVAGFRLTFFFFLT